MRVLKASDTARANHGLVRGEKILNLTPLDCPKTRFKKVAIDTEIAYKSDFELQN